jgi:hypothetical protein
MSLLILLSLLISQPEELIFIDSEGTHRGIEDGSYYSYNSILARYGYGTESHSMYHIDPNYISLTIDWGDTVEVDLDTLILDVTNLNYEYFIIQRNDDILMVLNIEELKNE